MKTKSLLYNAYNANNEVNVGIGATLDVTVNLRPSSYGKYKHDESKRMYCDILGRKYCQLCCEEKVRETSFVKSLTEAENYISRVASPLRAPSIQSSFPTASQTNESTKSVIEEDKVENIVNYIFPIMYRSMSSSKVERPWTRAGSVSTVTSRSECRSMSRQRPSSGEISILSIVSLTSTDNFGDDERSLSSEANVKSACDRGESSEFDKQELPTMQRKVNEEIKGCSEEHHTNSKIMQEEEGDEFDGDKILDLKREITSKPYHFLVRRSSVVAKSVRKRTNEKIKDQLAKWTPSLPEEYARARSSFKRTGSFARQKRETTIQHIQARSNAQLSKNQIPYLERLKQPKVSESKLPMEPFICGIRYMKNRWRDEALYRNNGFAVKLGLLGN